jgi:vitamin B12 transporter
MIRTLVVYTLMAAVLPAADSTLEGVVCDPAGAALPSAEVTVYAPGSALPLARIRASDGRFSFAVPPARYRVEVSAAGFRATSIEAEPGTAVEVRLEVQGVDSRVFVTAEAAPQTVDEVSKAATLISAEDIAARNEYSLAEALRDTPGLLVRNLGGPGQATSIRLRGLRADATAILIDGLRFRDVATTQADASSFTSTLNVINLARVEVLRGSGSSLYGTNAVGGTINVVTDPGGGTPRGGIQLEGGSLGLLRGRATVGGGLAKNRLVYSAGLLHLNVLEGVDGDDRARSSGIQSFARYSLAPASSLSARLFLSDDFVQPNLSPTSTGLPTANIPNTTVVPAIALAPDQVRRSSMGLPIVPGNATFIPNRNDPDNHRSSRFWSTALVFRQQFRPDADGQISYQRVDTNRIFRNGPGGPGFQPAVSNFSQFRGIVDTVDSRINWRALPWLSLTGGYEFEREDYLNLDENRLPPPQTVSARTAANQRSHAGYFASQMTALNRRLQISASGRAQAFRLDRPSFAFAGTANNYETVALASPPRALTGDLAISYFLARTGTKLRAHGGNSYRAPGLFERFGSGFFYSPVTDAISFTPYGDPRLAPDRYNSIDAGIDQYLFTSRLRLSATWFYTRIVQLTQFDSAASVVIPGQDPFGRTSGYYAGAGGTSRGTEIAAEIRPYRNTLVRASYSYVNASTDQDLAVRGFFRALSVPPHSWTLLVNQQLSRRTTLTADLYHASAYHNSLFAAGRSRAYLYPNVTKIDLVLSHELINGDKFALRGYVKGDNVLNQRYFENGFQPPRATVLAGIQTTFR